MENPGQKYNITKYGLEWGTGLEGSVVYGNMVVVRPSNNKDWAEILSSDKGKSLGYVPVKGLSRTPAYEPTQITWYVTAMDGPELFLNPVKKRPDDRLARIKLLKGEIVPSVGKKDSMLLLRFDTFSLASGIGARYAWAEEGAFIPLSSYQPASGMFDPDWLPSAIRCLGYKNAYDEEENVCPSVAVPENIKSGLSAHGFYIDGTPVILEHVVNDDMGDSYIGIHRQQPVFISTDIYLHYFHLIFNRLLEALELASLEPGLEQNLSAALSALKSVESSLPPDLKGPWQTAVNMFSVPRSLIAEKPRSIKLSPEASKEVALVREASASNIKSPVFQTLTDYTMFKPRGHYTKSPVLSRYFLAMNYIGTAELALFDDTGNYFIPNLQTAALISMVLDSLGDKWLALEEPINYLIGASNTGDGKKFRDLVRSHMGTLSDPQSLQKLTDPAALQALATGILQEIEGPDIQSNVDKDQPGDDFLNRKPVFRISGKRFNLDAFIFNQLTYPRVGSIVNIRNIPEGTDVMAVLGSQAAERYVEKHFEIPQFRENFQKLKYWAPAYLSEDKTVYSLWLTAFQAGFKNSGADYRFYKDDLWPYKKLLTALASFAEIKHDTILYVEQSMSEGAEGADMPGDYAPPLPRGFVEPDPQVFQALLTATDALKSFIEKYDLETPKKPKSASGGPEMFMQPIPFRDRLSRFSDLLTKARDLASKEVSGQELTVSDYENIQSLAQSFNGMLYMGFQNDSGGGDLRMALIADAASSPDDILELATGTPRKMFVHVNDKWGGSRITMGYVFSYYEFPAPLSQGRMNDQEWQKIVYDPRSQTKLEQLRPAWYQNLVY
jgi:hypothetical protein